MYNEFFQSIYWCEFFLHIYLGGANFSSIPSQKIRCDERQVMKLHYYKKKLQIYNAFGAE